MMFFCKRQLKNVWTEGSFIFTLEHRMVDLSVRDSLDSSHTGMLIANVCMMTHFRGTGKETWATDQHCEPTAQFDFLTVRCEFLSVDRQEKFNYLMWRHEFTPSHLCRSTLSGGKSPHSVVVASVRAKT